MHPASVDQSISRLLAPRLAYARTYVVAGHPLLDVINMIERDRIYQSAPFWIVVKVHNTSIHCACLPASIQFSGSGGLIGINTDSGLGS